jgi:uncharacterized protein (TIGR00269 family)
MFKPNDRIALAVSGGKDSLSLLHILDKIESDFSESEIIVVAVDEGIEHYRTEALDILEDNCKNIGLNYHIISFKELYGYTLDEIIKLSRDKNGLLPCSICGVFRRRALNVIARKVQATKLATAHNLDDEIQTMMLNLIRGDVTRIQRIKPVQDFSQHFVQRVKPFCKVLEKEIALYAYFKNITFQTFPCPYAGTALRNDVRKMLNQLETKHPGTKFSINRAFEKIQPAIKVFSPSFEIRKCLKCGEVTVNEICRPCHILKDLDLK